MIAPQKPVMWNGSVVFGNHEGQFRQPERISHLFREQQARCARMLGDDAPPRIQLHDYEALPCDDLARPREREGGQRSGSATRA